MGILDDAIRDHLELKRRRGADQSEIERAEREALDPVRRHPERFADPIERDDNAAVEEQGELDADRSGRVDERVGVGQPPNEQGGPQPPHDESGGVSSRPRRRFRFGSRSPSPEPVSEDISNQETVEYQMCADALPATDTPSLGERSRHERRRSEQDSAGDFATDR
jgi:hypothetical protein